MNNLLQILISNALLLQGCSNTEINEKQNAINMDTTIHNKVIVDTVSPFQSFVNKFDYRELPYNINVASNDWINFNKTTLSEINRADVVKFLCNKNDNCVKQPTGGFYQYYFGYRIKLKEKVGLIYYRISSDYTGYVLSIFDTVGVLQSSLFLSGVKGEYDPEAQKEAVIGSDCLIEIGEIIFKSGIDYSGTIFKANYSLKKYQVSLQGNIDVLSTVNRMEIDVKCDKTQKDRVILVK